MINIRAGLDMGSIFTPSFTPVVTYKSNGKGTLGCNKKAPTGCTIILLTGNPADPLLFIIKRE